MIKSIKTTYLHTIICIFLIVVITIVVMYKKYINLYFMYFNQLIAYFVKDPLKQGFIHNIKIIQKTHPTIMKLNKKY